MLIALRSTHQRIYVVRLITRFRTQNLECYIGAKQLHNLHIVLMPRFLSSLQVRRLKAKLAELERHNDLTGGISNVQSHQGNCCFCSMIFSGTPYMFAFVKVYFGYLCVQILIIQ